MEENGGNDDEVTASDTFSPQCMSFAQGVESTRRNSILSGFAKRERMRCLLHQCVPTTTLFLSHVTSMFYLYLFNRSNLLYGLFGRKPSGWCQSVGTATFKSKQNE